MSISVQFKAIDCNRQIDTLRARAKGLGALVTFTGYVRDLGLTTTGVSELFLEHYPGMTERSLEAIVAAARQRWQLLDVAVTHRVGSIAAAEPIVLVGVASLHRQAAFDACAYIMDQLKTCVPFWKCEQSRNGARWVDARESDAQAAARWLHNGGPEPFR
ncbi:molybdenum cofactor biosynthesis protein MoaE [Pseudomonas sp. NPDC090755]|uniref:molybdenum cofactor biosynthesis protein MoaE n=1 Tax=Pseudomonas sp. NPDC090755 TaxID=3364481 RepID=UPI00383B6898